MIATSQAISLCHMLDVRRKRLGMSYAVLAKRSGVSMTTVVRILSGQNPQASFENVCAVAAALDLAVRVEPTASAEEVRERQARRKAEQLVGMVQGTSGLEGQALEEETLAQMTRQTAHELLAGSPRRLWGE